MTIVAAAYQVGEMTISVPRPGRHKDIPLDTFAWAHHVVWRARSNAVAGFLTDDGQFLDRLAAVAYVDKCGQPLTCLTINPQLGLFSEDLW